jgi:hypothetical protein
MPLVRARCKACTLPLGDPPLVAMNVRCGRCGESATVNVAADGQPADFDPSFEPPKLVAWLAYARMALAAGTLGVAVGGCKRCGAPFVVSSRDPVSLPCPHCGEVVAGTTAAVLLDQWTEPWTRVEGGGMRLEYRLELVDAKTGLSAGCAACGEPSPPRDPSNKCARCGSATWVTRGDARVQLGVRVDGTRDDRPFKVLLPICQGEAMLRGDAARGTSARSGTSVLGATGIGCASVVAAVLALSLLVWLLVHFGKC